jgi:hypothetical protein
MGIDGTDLFSKRSAVLVANDCEQFLRPLAINSFIKYVIKLY